MSKSLLIPHQFKRLGWWMLIAGVIIEILAATILNGQFKGFDLKVFAIMSDEGNFTSLTKNVTNELIAILLLAGALLVAFSKEKREDEFIGKLRLTSLLWAVLVNYALLILSVLLVFGMPFFAVIVYNMFTILIIFIARFHYVLYKASKSGLYEK